MVVDVDITKIKIPPTKKQDYYKPNSDINDLVQSIRKHGLYENLVLDHNYYVVDGVHRLRACQALGMRSVPCVIHHYKDKVTLMDRIIKLLNKDCSLTYDEIATILEEDREVVKKTMMRHGYEPSPDETPIQKFLRI